RAAFERLAQDATARTAFGGGGGGTLADSGAGGALRAAGRMLAAALPSGATAVATVEWLAIAVSLLNAVYCATRRRRYVLFQQPTRPAVPGDATWLVRSPNAHLVKVDAQVRRRSGMPPPHRAHAYVSPLDGAAAFDGDGVLDQGHGDGRHDDSHGGGHPHEPDSFYEDGDGDDDRDDDGNDDIVETVSESHWVLDVWSPPPWSINLFCWFSPPHVAVLYGATPGWNSAYFLVVGLFTGFALHGIVAKYQDLLHDKEILAQQLMREYTQGYVYKHLPAHATNLCHGSPVGGAPHMVPVSPDKGIRILSTLMQHSYPHPDPHDVSATASTQPSAPPSPRLTRRSARAHHHAADADAADAPESEPEPAAAPSAPSTAAATPRARVTRSRFGATPASGPSAAASPNLASVYNGTPWGRGRGETAAAAARFGPAAAGAPASEDGARSPPAARGLAGFAADYGAGLAFHLH
ncbi:hypothetical protein CXG81DRAFT_25601, partial [Caulochytrium protostelioides]